MIFHGAPIVRCTTPDCTRCHCKECIDVRVNSTRLLLQFDVDKAVFVWDYPWGFNLNLRLDLRNVPGKLDNSG